MLATVPKGFLATDQPDLFFEDNAVGRMKKEVWEASDEQIDAILEEYGIPSPVEWGKTGSYIQTTTRWKVEANRRKNDIVFIPVGCTELHGRHLPSAPTHCTSARSARGCAASPPGAARPSTSPSRRSTTADTPIIIWACLALSLCASMWCAR